METRNIEEIGKLEGAEMVHFADESTQRLRELFKFDFNTGVVNSFVWAMEQASEAISQSATKTDFDQRILDAIAFIKNFFAGKEKDFMKFQGSVVDFSDYLTFIDFATDGKYEKVEDLLNDFIMLSAKFDTL